MGIAKHGSGDNVYLIRFHYMPPGAVEYSKVETSAEDGRDEDRRRATT